jgi:hypothetical protein
LTGETKELGEEPVPMPLCPPQIPHFFLSFFIYLPTTESISPITGGMQNVIQNMHLHENKQTKEELYTSKYSTYKAV